MARSVLEIILSLKGDKARGELKKVDKDLGRVEKAAKKTGAGIKGLNKNMLAMGAAVGGAVFAGKKLVDTLWAMGKRGAAVEQTTQSWEFLLNKIGAAPDILDKMRKEVKGTVDDMTLMSSTMTLLAGTSDELGKALLDQSPQLLKIAKAANKLNPSLGDTAFMYESISKGIKRASPLILDNLGLNIKMEEAFKAQAKALGKSVDALNSEERAMAILNDTMRAGNLLIAQVGGNVDAAGDSYARMEVAITSLKDELAALASEGLEPTVTLMADVVKTSRENVSTWGLIDRALRDGTITQQEYNEWIKDYLFHGGKQSELLAKIESRIGLVDGAVVELTGHERAYIEQIIELAGHERAYVEEIESAEDALWKSSIASASMTREMYEAAEAGRSMAVRLRGMSDELKNQIDATIEYVQRLKDIKIADFFDVDLGIGDVAARMFDINNFKQAGGEALEVMVEEVKAGLAENKITPEQANEFFKNISVEAAAIEVEMEKIDVSEAAEQISEDFNIPLEEARGLIDNVIEGIDLVNSTDISEVIQRFDELEERKAGIVEPAEIPLEVDPWDKATGKLIEIEDGLFQLVNDPWIIEVEIVTRGKIPNVSSGKVTTEEGPGGQYGMDFVVPPGYANDTFPMRVSSGEHVTVTPRGQSQGGEIITNHQYVTQHFHSEGAAALGMAITRKFGRDRLNVSMGR